MGLDIMSTTDTHAKNRGAKMNVADKKAAQMAANRKAQLQWYAMGAALVIAIVAAIVLVVVFTDGAIPLG